MHEPLERRMREHQGLLRAKQLSFVTSKTIVWKGLWLRFMSILFTVFLGSAAGQLREMRFNLMITSLGSTRFRILRKSFGGIVSP